MKFYSPDETGWYYAPRGPIEFNIVKPGRVKGETFAFSTYALKLRPDEDRAKLIVNYKNEIKTNNNASTRFKNIKIDVNEYPEGPGGNCLLRYWIAEDHAPAGLEGKGPMSLESLDFVCIHPLIRHTAANRLARVRAQPGVVASIVFASLPPEQVGNAESQLLREFEDEFWDVPFLNSQRGYARGADQHYRG
jgi:hypothetical protein